MSIRNVKQLNANTLLTLFVRFAHSRFAHNSMLTAVNQLNINSCYSTTTQQQHANTQLQRRTINNSYDHTVITWLLIVVS